MKKIFDLFGSQQPSREEILNNINKLNDQRVIPLGYLSEIAEFLFKTKETGRFSNYELELAEMKRNTSYLVFMIKDKYIKDGMIRGEVRSAVRNLAFCYLYCPSIIDSSTMEDFLECYERALA